MPPRKKRATPASPSPPPPAPAPPPAIKRPAPLKAPPYVPASPWKRFAPLEPAIFGLDRLTFGSAADATHAVERVLSAHPTLPGEVVDLLRSLADDIGQWDTTLVDAAAALDEAEVRAATAEDDVDDYKRAEDETASRIDELTTRVETLTDERDAARQVLADMLRHAGLG